MGAHRGATAPECATANGVKNRKLQNPKKKITLAVPEPLDRAVETYCLVTGTPKNEAAVRAFREFIKKHEKDTLRRLGALKANTTAAAAGA
jgi:hypothetical protein